MTYRCEHDARAGVFACRFSSGGDPLGDYDEHLDRLEEITRAPRSGAERLAILVIFDRSYPLPDARTRKRAAQVTSGERFDHHIGIVSQNPLVRGVLTAIGWLRAQRHVHEVFVSPEDAMEWLDDMRGERIAALRELSARLHAAEIARTA